MGGVPNYRAPETWLSAPFDGKPADMWSFGCVCYELMHGQPAFDATSLTQLSLQIRRCAHRELSEALSAPAIALLRATLVREPMMRAGPKHMAHVLLAAWKKELQRRANV